LSLADVPSRESAAANHYQALLGVEGQFAAVQREAQAAEIGVRAAEERAGSGLEQVDGAAAAHQEAKVCLDRAKQDQEATASLLASKRAFCMTAAETLETAKQERAQMESLASQKDAEAQGRMNTAAAHSERLPESMRSQALQDAASMIVDLDAAKERLAEASALLTHLRLAEQNQAGWDGERRSKETEIGEIPEAHRVGVEEAQAGLRLAERANLEAMESVQEAASELARLEERLERREELEAQSETATRRQRLFNKLNRLLGKSGLQGALVTGALDSIKNHANAFLEHLTGGSLVLELHKGTGADELDLRAVDTTCMREARSVQALSGSQKFRCAVAIAMGIGQYAGGRMRSIVIDEGFGSLDEIGQEQMVDELKNLSDNMDKVIVVSHLDLFRDRDHFPYQLHVEKAGTASHLRVVA
jgi:exonuclease SbcC